MPQACVTPSTTATAVARAPLGGNEPYQHEPRATSAQRAVYKVQLGYVLLPPELNLLRQAQQQPPPLPPPPPPHAEPVANTASREPRRYRGSLAIAAAGMGMIVVLPQHTAAACAIQAAQRRRRDRQTFLKLQRVIWAALQLPVRQVLRRLAPPREGRLLADLPDEAPPLLPCPTAFPPATVRAGVSSAPRRRCAGIADAPAPAGWPELPAAAAVQGGLLPARRRHRRRRRRDRRRPTVARGRARRPAPFHAPEQPLAPRRLSRAAPRGARALVVRRAVRLPPASTNPRLASRVARR